MKVDPTCLNDLLNKLIAIDQKYYSNPNDKDGDIGERFVKDSIKYYMWNYDFKLRNTGDRTFKFGKHPKKGLGGADFPFSFTYNNVVYDCYIEAKNWKVYSYISNSWFNKEILNRFIQNITQPGCKRIVTMNKNNIPLISKRCQQNQILIVPMDSKITTIQLNIASLTPIMEHFLDDFDTLMTRSLTGVQLYKPIKQPKAGSKPYDDAIRLGLPSDLIAKMYGTTPKNIEKRRSELKSQGENILDWRSKTARDARLLTKDQLDRVYKEIIRKMIEEEDKTTK